MDQMAAVRRYNHLGELERRLEVYDPFKSQLRARRLALLKERIVAEIYAVQPYTGCTITTFGDD